MSTIIQCETLDGTTVEFVDEVIGSGMMKDVYFSPDKSYVVALYKTPQDAQAKERLEMIVGRYRNNIFNQTGGSYWQNLFCWPVAILEHEGRLGLVAPTYPNHFFFEHGSVNGDFMALKGKEKEGKWFASANLRKRFIDPRELGDWLNHFKACTLLARAVRRMHNSGLAHSDLSYKNVLIDPSHGYACVIDLDGLVVPGKYPPDVVGTPDFIAPEVVKTSHLKRDDPLRKLPCRETDQHALAVLIYLYLLYRHPLRGKKIHDMDDDANDETLSMGEHALFVEHPSDDSNRINLGDAKPSELPWADTGKLPFTITGPYLSALFRKAFIHGLHQANQRPSADEWETALTKTADLLLPCKNPDCAQKWYVYDNSANPACPFCGTHHKGGLLAFEFYSSHREGNFRADNHRLMVWNGQSLFPWHVNNLIAPNEKLDEQHSRRVGYFIFHNQTWWLVNERLPNLSNASDKTPVPMQGKIALKDQMQLLLSNEAGGRLATVRVIMN